MYPLHVLQPGERPGGNEASFCWLQALGLELSALAIIFLSQACNVGLSSF